MSVPYGAYGLILPPQSIQGIDPTHVTKVFHTKKAYDKFLEKMGMIREIFQGDPNYLVYPFDRVYTLSNVPNQYKHTVSSRFSRNTNRNTKVEPLQQPIYAVHMPHLGVDLNHVKDILGHLRAIPVPIMLTNMYELLEKVAMLWNHEYVHGDVRPPNIMIQPETGKLTLIDFDWLMEVREFAKVYRPVTESKRLSGAHGPPTEIITHPHIPPEFLLSDMSQHLEETNFSADRTKIGTSRTTRIITDYCTHMRERFTYLNAYYQLAPLILTVKKAIEASIAYADNIVKEGRFPIMESYRTLDGYGIGQNLLELCHQLYPGSLTYAADPSMTLYEKSALNTMIHYVLKPLCMFSLHERKYVREVLGIASDIVASVQQEAAQEKPTNNAANKNPANEKPVNDKPVNQGNKQGGRRLKKNTKRRHNITRR
jgi:serine/threonine protein kinase